MDRFQVLTPFILANVRITGIEIGSGAYAKVEKVEIPGAICAAKKIHGLFENSSEIPLEDIQRVATQFVSECQLMTTLRHPHIVQFLGVCFFPDSRLPALVMELLSTNLHDLLATSTADRTLETATATGLVAQRPLFPLSLKCSILQDVANGLAYLHERSPPIIHRDLSARNVLLNSAMVAKIADLGVARIVSCLRGTSNMTQAPGACVYMPPEAVEASLRGNEHSLYDGTIDIFSLGIVVIFTLSQTFPEELLPRENNRTELERRGEYMKIIYDCLFQEHPLLTLIEQCLQNHPNLRPGIREVLQLLGDAKVMIADEGCDMTKLELIQTLHHQSRVQEGQISESEQELVIKGSELSQMEESNQSLRQQLEDKQVQLSTLEDQIQALRQQENALVQSKNEEVALIQDDKDRLVLQLQQLEQSNAARTSSLESKLTQSESLVAEFQSMLLQKTTEFEELACILDCEKLNADMPTPKPRKRHNFTPSTHLPKQSTDTLRNSSNPSASSTDAQGVQAPIVNLESKLNINCTAQPAAPFGMTRGSATSDRCYAYFTALGSNIVHRYSLNEKTWLRLPSCQYRNFGLAVIHNTLMAIGGREQYSVYSNKLLTLRHRHWVEEYPPMVHARDIPSVTTLECPGSHTNIIVVGGSVSDSNWTTSVEVLNTRDSTWCSLAPLPRPLAFPSATLCNGGDTMVLSVIGCYREGYSCSLHVDTSEDSISNSTWSSLPKLPVSGSTVATLRNQLVIVGGCNSGAAVSFIHQLINDQWVRIGTVSSGSECLIVRPSPDQLVIVGGEGAANNVSTCTAV